MYPGYCDIKEKYMGFGSDKLGFRILILQFGQVISPEYQFNHVYIKDEKTYVIEM